MKTKKSLKAPAHSVVSKLLWLFIFVVFGCSQRSCSCKRLETIKQEVVIVDRLGEKPGSKYPDTFIDLLYIKYLQIAIQDDSVTRGFKPNVTVNRLDLDKVTKNVQKKGMSAWQRFIRSIFPLSPEKYDASLWARFSVNEIGNDLSVRSSLTDSLKVLLINRFILNEIRGVQKCIFYFYSPDTNNGYYCCHIDLNDTVKKEASNATKLKQPPKLKGPGPGCANPETSAKQIKPDISKLDTIFRIIHSLDSINLLIARNSDSAIQNGSGCSVRDNTIKHIVIYDPPVSSVGVDSTIGIVNPSPGDTLCKNIKTKSNFHPDTGNRQKCTFILHPSSTRIVFDRNNLAVTKSQSLTTAPDKPDSIFWELGRYTNGLQVIMPKDQRKGTGMIPSFEVKKSPTMFQGTVTFKITYYKSACNPRYSSRTALFVYNFWDPDHCNPEDAMEINQLRKNIIKEFSELLYACQYAPGEKEYFRSLAKSKIHEIPKVQIRLHPVDDTALLFSRPVDSIIPILDQRNCYIIGVRVLQRTP